MEIDTEQFNYSPYIIMYTSLYILPSPKKVV